MNILYYQWNDLADKDMIISLTELGHNLKIISLSYTDYDDDPIFTKSFEHQLNTDTYDFIFTFDFFPIISKSAQNFGIPYISWIYDMPHSTLDSPQLNNSVNHIFVFDYVQYNLLLARGSFCHLYHLPLPVNTKRITNSLGEPPLNCGSKYDVSFVGGLYDKCLYNQIAYLPEYLDGYLNGIIEAQQKVYGYNFVDELLLPDILQSLQPYVQLDMPADYATTYKSLFSNILNAKITSCERIHLLTKVSDYYNLTLISGSDPHLVPHAHFAGTVDYITEMPAVFRTSKINLNITLRSIISGIPLRAMDIMGAGGFLLSNYQPELTEFFIENEDCVLFESENDLLNKIEYYLSHEKERIEISQNGYQKVHEFYSYEALIPHIINMVFHNNETQE